MTDISQHSLCETLTSLAQWTNNTIAKGYLTGLGILEETITDYILNEVAALHPRNVYTKKFSKKQEGNESGADWLWCIGNPGQWLPILVQAKIVNPRTKQCHYLDYGIQGQLLIRYARNHRLLPLYCIYSFIEPETIPEAKKVNSLMHLTPAHWACSLIIPKYVRQLIRQKAKSQSALLKYGIPWMKPFCSNDNDTPADLSHAVSHFLRTIHNEFKDRDEQSTTATLEQSEEGALVTSKKQKEFLRVQWASVDPMLLITPRFPKIAIRLLTSRVLASDAPISNISIISNTPLEEVLKIEGALPASNRVLPVFKGRKKRGLDSWRPH